MAFSTLLVLPKPQRCASSVRLEGRRLPSPHIPELSAQSKARHPGAASGSGRMGADGQGAPGHKATSDMQRLLWLPRGHPLVASPESFR